MRNLPYKGVISPQQESGDLMLARLKDIGTMQPLVSVLRSQYQSDSAHNTPNPPLSLPPRLYPLSFRLAQSSALLPSPTNSPNLWIQLLKQALPRMLLPQSLPAVANKPRGLVFGSGLPGPVMVWAWLSPPSISAERVRDYGIRHLNAPIPPV